jgi:hypothetical protein
MPKTTPMGIRLAQETKDALARAAKDDLRSLNSLIEKILTDWVKESGYAPEPPKPARAPRRGKVEALQLEAAA